MDNGHGVLEIYKNYWKDAFKVTGRINRTSFWISYLCFILLFFFFMFIGYALDLQLKITDDTWMFSSVMPIIWYFINAIPLSTSYIRRLHDVDVKSYWAGIPIFLTFIFAIFGKSLIYLGLYSVVLLIAFSIIFALLAIPILGLIFAGLAIILIIVIIALVCIVYFSIFCAKGTVGPNRFGSEPPKNNLLKL